MSTWGLAFLAIGFLALLGVLIAVALGSGRTATRGPVVAEPAGEPFARGWWTMHWLPGRYSPAGATIGVAWGVCAWLLLLPRSIAASLLAFLVIVVAGEYSGEAAWQALQQRRWGRCTLAVIGCLLWVSAMGLHAGTMAGFELPFPYPRFP